MTFSSTPTLRVANSCGVPAVIATPAEPPPLALPVPTWLCVWPKLCGYRSSCATVIVAGFPDNTVTLGALSKSVPCFCESARTMAFTSNSPMTPVMLAKAVLPAPRYALPGICGALLIMGILSSGATAMSPAASKISPCGRTILPCWLLEVLLNAAESARLPVMYFACAPAFCWVALVVMVQLTPNSSKAPSWTSMNLASISTCRISL